jgi:hypothetical protein
MAERGIIIYEEEDEIREEMNEIGLDGDNAELTPGPRGGFILVGEDAETLANHKGMVTTDLADIPGYSEEPEEPEEPPTLTSISPDTAVIGDAAVTMVCSGSGFAVSSEVVFAGNPEPTTFVSETEVSAVVDPGLGWTAGPVDVMVRDGMSESESLPFTFTAPVGRGAKRR